MCAKSVTLAAVVLIWAATAGPASAQPPTTPVLFDRQMTAGAGATVIVGTGDAIARAEEAAVPARLLAEQGVARRSANMAYRLVRLLYFDLPQEEWLGVANHEVFGHGARLRERFDGSISYGIPAPSPYGPGGGVTRFRFDREPSVHELLAVTVAGMEADAVAARVIADRAFDTRRMSHREALRYLVTELDALDYILNTGDEPEESGHDVSEFLMLYNEVAALVDAPGLKARTLRREALFSLANPMIGYAAYAIGQWMWNGAATSPVPALTFGGVRYLPLLRYRLAPYGPEWSLDNEMSGRLKPTRIELRAGRAPGSRPWGLGFRQRQFMEWRGYRFDLDGAVWRQPRLTLNASDTVTSDTAAGVHASVRVERRVPAWRVGGRTLSIVIELGAKTTGYVPGEPLGGGMVVRGGAGW
jgi:hypothetical protein